MAKNNMYGISNKEGILMRLLNCGSLDLSMLDDIGYDLDEIIDELQEDGCLSLNNIFESVFNKGIQEVYEALEDIKKIIKDDIEDEDTDEEEHNAFECELKELEKLNPEEDIDYFTNCLDTHISINNNQDIYRDYLIDDLKEIEKNMGFDFENF